MKLSGVELPTQRHPRSVGGSAGQRHTVTRRVHDLLRTELRSGTAVHREFVEHVLIAELNASRAAVRRALRLLAAQGLLHRRPGSGTVAAGTIHTLPVDDVASPTTVVRVSKVDDRQVPSTPQLREVLGTAEDRVGLLQHVFTAGTETIGTRWAYYHAHVRQPELTDAVCPDLESAFLAVFAKDLARVRTFLDAGAADATTAALLGLAVGDPVLQREELLVDCDGVPQEWAFATYRADHVAFSSSARIAPVPPSLPPPPGSEGQQVVPEVLVGVPVPDESTAPQGR